jgi:hypothetical protein
VPKDTKAATSVRIDEDLLKAIRLADATGEERLSLTDAIDVGLRLVLAARSGKAPAPPPTPLDALTKANRALALELISALSDDTRTQQDRDDLITTLKALLRVFARRNR